MPDPKLPHERTRRRRRAVVRHILSKLHRDAVTRRRAAAVLAAVLSVTTLLAFNLGDGAPETMPLGRGSAGVRGVPVAASATALRPPAPPPPPAPAEPKPTEAEAAGKPVTGGTASYYGEELAGRPTASGERFDPDRLTAAHRTLPLGSRLRVTNPRNGRSVVVRVNDRGPFAKGRVIDLSKGAARQIGLLQQGHGQVRLELMGG